MNAEPTKKHEALRGEDTSPHASPESSLDEKIVSDPDMRDEYDFQGGVRGKYAHRVTRAILRNMVPEHAQETWDAEQAVYGELISRPGSKSETEED